MKYYKKNGTPFETKYGVIVPCMSPDVQHRKLADLPQYDPSNTMFLILKVNTKNT